MTTMATNNEDAPANNKSDDEREQFIALLHANIAPSVDFTTLTKLNLPNCGLSSLPACMPSVLPNLSILFMPNNQFEELPAILGSCLQLQMVSFKNNGMRSIHPDALQSQLRWLILTGNAIHQIPDTIGRCRRLQKWMLSGNQLTQLPEAVQQLDNLELIRLACNRLQEPPMHLLGLKNLRWAAVSNNPFITHYIQQRNNNNSNNEPALSVLQNAADLDNEDWPVLGQGAGGVTRKATYDGKDVAVKTYAGELTSDGSPLDEKIISRTAFHVCQQHPCLIQLLGETNNGALVMEFLDGYTALAGPPSMQTCSRDVYDASTKLTTAQVRTLLVGLSQVLEKLHANGICHGDFYAHNILIRLSADGIDVKLSDFGAAFFYDAASQYGSLVQRCEVRAFGVLIEEVVALASDGASPTLDKLKAVAATAAGTDAFTFAQIRASIEERA